MRWFAVRFKDLHAWIFEVSITPPPEQSSESQFRLNTA
jgi:hypothetical protein